MEKKLVYKDCWFTILNAHEIGVDNDGWDEGVSIPFKDANFYFVEKIRDGEHVWDLGYVEDERTQERYYPKDERGGELAREELDREWFE